MEVEYNDLVRVTEETKFLICHFDCTMVDVSKVSDDTFKLFSAVLDVRIGHLNRLEHVCLLLELLFLDLEVLDSVCKVRAFDLLTSVVFDFMSCFGDILSAEMDQTEVLFEVLLLPKDTCFFYLERFYVLQLDFSLLAEDFLDDLFEVFVDLSHDLYLSLLDLLPEIVSLVKQEFCSTTECFQILDDFLAIFLQYVDYNIQHI